MTIHERDHPYALWSETLGQVWNLRTHAECLAFSDLMQQIKGDEDIHYAKKILEAVRLQSDYGVYESAWVALWSFPHDRVGELVAADLPALLRKKGLSEQVERFCIPLVSSSTAQRSFLQAAEAWTATDKQTVLRAMKKWAADAAQWEELLKNLGVRPTQTSEDPIPEDWPESWQQRLKKGRAKKGDYGISGLVWQGGKKTWLEDLDFLIALLALNHGRHWRQVNAMTNPLWGFGNAAVYPSFLRTVQRLPEKNRAQLLANIKKVNKSKYKLLLTDLDNC